MGRPHQRPRPPEAFVPVCRVASIGHLRRLIGDPVLPVPGNLLAEVVPLGVVVCEEDRNWIAASINVDLLGLPMPMMTTAWIERVEFDALMPMRTFMRGIPDTVHELFGPTLGAPLSRRRIPSSRTVQSVQPKHGKALAEAWESGHSPFLRTIAWLDQALHLVVDESQRNEIIRLRDRLTDGYPAAAVRRSVVAALSWAVPLVGDGSTWPTMKDRIMDALRLNFDISHVLADETESRDGDDDEEAGDGRTD